MLDVIATLLFVAGIFVLLGLLVAYDSNSNERRRR